MERLPTWAWVTMAVLVALGVLFFFQTRDPMIMIFFIVFPAMILGVVLVLDFLARALRGGVGGVRVKCRECAALNLEDARFCSACGKQV